jgi:predicted DNA-binding protein
MEPKKDKVSRSLKLESDINDRLVSVCKHLGVNPNAYLVNEIGKAISRDEVAFVLANNSKNSMNDMMSLIQGLLVDNK